MTKIFIHGLATLDQIHLINYLPKKPLKYRSLHAKMKVGGNAASSSIAVTRLNGKSYLSSLIGHDIAGNFIENILKKERVNLNYLIKLVNYRTSFSSILIDKNGERQIINARHEFDSKLEYKYNFNSFDGFLIDTRDLNSSLKILKQLKNVNKPILLDAEDNTNMDIVKLCTHVCFSYDGLLNFTKKKNIESALKFLKKQKCKNIFVTHGKNGCYYLRNNRLINVPTIKIKALDTLGAGDVWHGAFILMLSRKYDLDYCIKFANIASSLKCIKFGGSDGCPTFDEVVKYI